MHTHGAVLDLAAIAVVLSLDSHRMVAALGRTGLINGTNRIGMSMLFGDNSLTSIAKFFFIPPNRFKKPLERAWLRIELKRDCFDAFSMHVRQLTLNVDSQQPSSFRRFETIGEQGKEQSELPAQA